MILPQGCSNCILILLFNLISESLLSFLWSAVFLRCSLKCTGRHKTCRNGKTLRAVQGKGRWPVHPVVLPCIQVGWRAHHRLLQLRSLWLADLLCGGPEWQLPTVLLDSILHDFHWSGTWVSPFQHTCPKGKAQYFTVSDLASGL